MLTQRLRELTDERDMLVYSGSGNPDVGRFKQSLRTAGNPYADGVAKQAQKSTSEQPKTLTAEQAKAILAQAGGNKDRARQIARERGFKF